MAAGGSKKVVYAALGANAVIAVAKGAVGLLTGSVAMLAEAAHSVADTTNQVFLLLSINLSDNPADEEHPFGYGKERFFWAFLAAVFIFVAGAFFSIYEGIKKLFETEAHHGSFWPSYVVLGLAFVFDAAVLVIALREARHQAQAQGRGTLAFLRETPDVTLKTALYEDAAATIGVAIAVVGLVLLQTTNNPVFDGIASILIGLVLVVVAIMLGRETRDLLLGAAAAPSQRQAIRDAIGTYPEVEAVVSLLTMQLGLDSILVTGEINIRDNLTTEEIERLLQRITLHIREAVPDVKNLYLEPHQVSAGTGAARPAAAPAVATG